MKTTTKMKTHDAVININIYSFKDKESKVIVETKTITSLDTNFTSKFVSIKTFRGSVKEILLDPKVRTLPSVDELSLMFLTIEKNSEYTYKSKETVPCTLELTKTNQKLVRINNEDPNSFIYFDTYKEIATFIDEFFNDTKHN